MLRISAGASIFRIEELNVRGAARKEKQDDRFVFHNVAG